MTAPAIRFRTMQLLVMIVEVDDLLLADIDTSSPHAVGVMAVGTQEDIIGAVFCEGDEVGFSREPSLVRRRGRV